MTEYQTGLRRMPPGFDLDGHLARLDADGFTIVKDYLGEDQLARFREDLKPYLNAYRGRNSFEGLATERVSRWWGAAESTRRSRATTGCWRSSTVCSHPTTC